MCVSVSLAAAMERDSPGVPRYPTGDLGSSYNLRSRLSSVITADAATAAPAPALVRAPRAAAPHTVARPDAPAEPVAETRAAAPTRKHRLNTACTFVIAPGASGANFCYELTECLRRLGHATEVEKWHGAYSKDIKRNADRLELVAKEAAAASGEGCRVLLVGEL